MAPADEYAAQRSDEFDGTKLKPTLREGLDMESEAKPGRKTRGDEGLADPLTKLLKEVLGVKPAKVERLLGPVHLFSCLV